jgi:hypothetical protein
MGPKRKAGPPKLAHPRALLFGSGDWARNLCFSDPNKPPLSIDYVSLKECQIPSDWGSRAGATRAANRSETLARLVGTVVLSAGCSSPTAKELCSKNTEILEDEEGEIFDEDGEFATAHGQIPLSRVVDEEYAGNLQISQSEKAVMMHLFALQSPASSPWRLPFIRLISNHEYDTKTETLTIYYYVYFTRLIFELIADPAIKGVMSAIVDIPVPIIRTSQREPQPVMFQSTGLNTFSQEAYKFSLAGLLKRAENKGYQLAPQQPDGLAVELFEFQRSTYQWMLDQENDEGGLNSYFWEEWQCADGGGPMYYFPLAGEFRLSKPPKTTGGLLCEEMGLGEYQLLNNAAISGSGI